MSAVLESPGTRERIRRMISGTSVAMPKEITRDDSVRAQKVCDGLKNDIRRARFDKSELETEINARIQGHDPRNASSHYSLDARANDTKRLVAIDAKIRALEALHEKHWRVYVDWNVKEHSLSFQREKEKLDREKVQHDQAVVLFGMACDWLLESLNQLQRIEDDFDRIYSHCARSNSSLAELGQPIDSDDLALPVRAETVLKELWKQLQTPPAQRICGGPQGTAFPEMLGLPVEEIAARLMERAGDAL